MLVRLSVSNLAIVEKVEVEFAPGLNVITGETGAGKSVLMGALDLVIGGRADPSVVREGAREARIEAEFFVAEADGRARVAAVLDEAGLAQCEDGILTVRRVIPVVGSGRVWVNDGASTVATLKRLGRLLADIHGPRANQSILEEGFQRATLDAYGAHAAALRTYGEAWSAWQKLRSEAAELEGDLGEDEFDMLRFQVGELEEASLADDDETISERHAAAAHAGEVIEAANAITEALGGDDGAARLLAEAEERMRQAARHFPEAEAWAVETDELAARVQELSRSVADAASRIDLGEEDMEELDRRLTLVNRLKRKYHAATVAELQETAAVKRARLDALEHRGERLAELRGLAAAAEKAVTAAGAKLTKCRLASGAKLSKAVTGELRDLGFLQARFSLRLEPVAPETHGCDRVEYVFEPNPGEPARPLAAIASSGETARVMLALKSVLAAHDAVGLLVFDEIDANIGGEVGLAVGEKLRRVADHRQVVAITHLPQSAVYGERHLVVSKRACDGRTRTGVAIAEGAARVDEIARMLGGEGLTGIVRKHAEELLRHGKKS